MQSFQTHNDLPIKTNGTTHQGFCFPTYSLLVDTFGLPRAGDGYNTDAEWHIEFEDGTVATVYNFKNGPASLGTAAKPVERIEDWMIGGKSREAVRMVREALGLDNNGIVKREPAPAALTS